MNSNIKQLPHQVKAPLSIERDISMGHEIIIIEGMKYDADYFRTFAYPETDVLYAVRNLVDEVVCLTVVRTVEEAKIFFDEIGQGNPAPTEEEDGI